MNEGLFGAPPELPPEDKRVCQVCGRFFYEGFDTLDDWLIGRQRYQQKHRRRNTEWIIQCPQHITVWGLRITGRGRSAFQLRLAADAKARDSLRPIPKDPFTTPFPSRSTWTE